ncbi:MAG: DsbA family protein, partial [Deltaproteobacteria bacterium]|nr:DsbA family protein [Deltaproteobacteria bacterium]
TKQIVEIYFDFSDPYCYVFLDDLFNIAEMSDIECIWQPLNPKAAGLPQPVFHLVEGEDSYIREEVTDLCKEKNLELNFPPEWPSEDFDVSRVTRASFVAIDMGLIKEFNFRSTYRIWGLGEDPTKDNFLIEVAEDLDVDLGEFLTKVAAIDTRERAKGVISRAKKFGVFKTPTVLVGGKRFYGYWNIPKAFKAIKDSLD